MLDAPALLIALLTTAIQSINSTKSFDIVNILLRYAFWFVAVIVLHIAVRLLRGKGLFMNTLRAAAFAQSAHVLELLGFLPVIGPVARFLGVVVSFFGLWIGTAAAQGLRGWRTFLLPVLYLLVLITSIIFIKVVLEGAAFAFESVLNQLGWTPSP
jgi:hypothetical protein